MAMSETLKAGQKGSLTKSVTEPLEIRSIRLPSAPPISRPVGSHSSGRAGRMTKYTTSAVRAARVRISTSAPPPEKKPKATPELRTCTSWTPGRNLCTSPSSMPFTTRCLVIRSTMITAAATASARRNATLRCPVGEEAVSAWTPASAPAQPRIRPTISDWAM